MGVFLLFVTVAVGDVPLLPYKKIVARQRKISGRVTLLIADAENAVHPLYVLGYSGTAFHSVGAGVAYELGP